MCACAPFYMILVWLMTFIHGMFLDRPCFIAEFSMAQDMDFFSALLVAYFLTSVCKFFLPVKWRMLNLWASLPFGSSWVITKISLDSFFPPIACLSFDKEFISSIKWPEFILTSSLGNLCQPGPTQLSSITTLPRFRFLVM